MKKLDFFNKTNRKTVGSFFTEGICRIPAKFLKDGQLNIDNN
jgi:hypothetical protein